MVDTAVGTASSYSESLAGVTQQLGSTADREGLRAIVESLVQTAKEMEQANHKLEARLSASKQEINQLQENLEVVRTESLTDPLTSLANRKFFDTSLAETIGEAPCPAQAAVADDDRHRSFQEIQRHLRSPDRRPGAASCRHSR